MPPLSSGEYLRQWPEEGQITNRRQVAGRCLNHSGSTSKLTRPDTTVHLNRSCRIPASADRNCFGSTQSTNSVLDRGGHIVLAHHCMSVSVCYLRIHSQALSRQAENSRENRTTPVFLLSALCLSSTARRRLIFFNYTVRQRKTAQEIKMAKVTVNKQVMRQTDFATAYLSPEDEELNSSSSLLFWAPILHCPKHRQGKRDIHLKRKTQTNREPY